MNRKIFLASPDDIKAQSVINYNVEDSVLADCIRKAQSMYLREILGDNLLEKLQDMVEDGSIEAEGNEKYLELLDNYILDFLANQALVELCPVISFKVRSIGVAQDSDANINASAKQDIADLADFYNTRVCDSANRLIDFLIEANFEEIRTYCACGRKQANLKKWVNTRLYV